MIVVSQPVNSSNQMNEGYVLGVRCCVWGKHLKTQNQVWWMKTGSQNY